MDERFSHQNGFASTHWTTIQACAGTGSAAQAAREVFCRDYWYPVYAYIRRGHHAGADAEDLTQDFFAFILNRPWLERADQTKGRFRSFLKVSLDRFLSDRAAHRNTLRRGGKYQHIPLDDGRILPRYAQDADPSAATTEVFEAEWAATIVNLAFKRLEADHATAEAQKRFAQLRIFLTISGDAASYEAAARALEISLENVKINVHRLRKRYGAILREEVSRTVSTPHEVDDEMQHVREIFALGVSAAA